MSFSQRIKTNFQETTYFTDYTDVDVPSIG